MNYPRPTYKFNNQEFEMLSFDEFRVKRGLLLISNQTIDYNIEKDRLDSTKIGRFRYIIWNEKAQNFNLNYQKAVKV